MWRGRPVRASSPPPRRAEAAILDELSIIDRFFRPLAGEGAFGLRDDAGRIAAPAGLELVVTTDMIAAGVHFLADDPPETIARKALRVNLSDLAAKGARPLAYTLALGLGPDAEETWLAAFAAGLRADQERFAIDLLGGDTIDVAAGPVISITAFGLVPAGRMVHRSGGRRGDGLYVSGAIGGALAGLALLRKRAGPWNVASDEERHALIARYRVPEPRTALAAAIRDHASAAIDVSDGLVGDCDKLADASGCSALLEAGAVPLAPGLAGRVDRTHLAALLAGGDDYEILAAIPAEREAAFIAAARAVDVPVTRIGALTEGRNPVQVRIGDHALPLDRRSYVHGKNRRPSP